MAVPAPISPTTSLMFDAVAEAAAVAESYVRAAGEFALARDTRGLCYALRGAAAALMTANTAAQALRPAQHDGGGR
ncbi:hypothetical protein [Methylobacterium pseudosasicola]|uniref:Uncharacterized protein n=1 Tax=Methylobacterium pseudosasicola TaxID=582667 RepID=A0A1I4SDT8_9HYPH|nr:hypothetical protein [Methylobacterium pseudosasicola]SFM62443.1 hypothetical protein SAMN05192568_104161 [Methylobacterium pseudosasicola]